MQRFVSFIAIAQDEVDAMTHEEFLKAKESPTFLADQDWDEWVWQFAESKEQAIAQHFAKIEEWEANPNKETY